MGCASPTAPGSRNFEKKQKAVMFKQLRSYKLAAPRDDQRHLVPFPEWAQREISKRLTRAPAAVNFIHGEFLLAWRSIDKNAARKNPKQKYSALAPGVDMIHDDVVGSPVWCVDEAYTDTVWDALMRHKRIRAAVKLAPPRTKHVPDTIWLSPPRSTAPPPEQAVPSEQSMSSEQCEPDVESWSDRAPPSPPSARASRKRRADPAPPPRRKKRARRRGPGLGLCCTNCGHSFNLTAFLGPGAVGESGSSDDE